MATREKLDLMLHVWDNSENVRDWYTRQLAQPFARDDFTVTNVREYGLGGLGEIADEIIEQGRQEQVIDKYQAANEAL